MTFGRRLGRDESTLLEPGAYGIDIRNDILNLETAVDRFEHRSTDRLDRRSGRT
jgi:hypothetical protein